MRPITIPRGVVFLLVAFAAVGPAYAGPMSGSALGFVHPIAECRPDLQGRCQALPPAVRDRVHILFLNGADPLCLGNVNGLCASVQGLGFTHASFHQLWQASSLAERIRQIRQHDPHARVVLVGFSAGCLAARGVANDLDRAGCPLDLLVYLAGDYITNTPRSRPANVRRVLNITGHGMILSGYDLLWSGEDIDGASNLRLDVRHIRVPSQPETIKALVEELLRVAEGLPR